MSRIAKWIRSMKQMNLWFSDRDIDKYNPYKTKSEKLTLAFHSMFIFSAFVILSFATVGKSLEEMDKEIPTTENFRFARHSPDEIHYWINKVLDVEKVGEFDYFDEDP